MRGVAGLPGGGPWRILEECPAKRHNVARASMREGCVCPRGLSAARKQRDAYNESRRTGKPAGWPQGLPGGGPWRILPECPARLHNSGRAGTHERCVCPRALCAKKEQQKPRTPPRTPPPANRNPEYSSNIRTDLPAPNLMGALCRSPEGMRLVDKRGSTMEIKAMCFRCPARERCLAWAARGEKPAGAWPGVYGGLSQAERRKAAA